MKSMKKVISRKDAAAQSKENAGRKLGFLLNFGAVLMTDGIIRVVTALPKSSFFCDFAPLRVNTFSLQ